MRGHHRINEKGRGFARIRGTSRSRSRSSSSRGVGDGPATKELWMSDSARTVFQFDSKTPLDHAALQHRVHPRIVRFAIPPSNTR
jgi:hypothetical protein